MTCAVEYGIISPSFFFQLIGCACVGVGVWIFTDDNGVKELADLTSTEHETTAYAVMIGGGIVMLISFLGCCGAKTENKFLLAIVSDQHFRHFNIPVCLVSRGG